MLSKGIMLNTIRIRYPKAFRYHLLGFIFGALFIPVVYFSDISLFYKNATIVLRSAFIAALLVVWFFRQIYMLRMRTFEKGIPAIIVLGIISCILVYNTVANRGDVLSSGYYAVTLIGIMVFFQVLGADHIFDALSGISLYCRGIIIANVITMFLYHEKGIYNFDEGRNFYLCGNINTFVKIVLPTVAILAMLDIKRDDVISPKTIAYTAFLILVLLYQKTYTGVVGMLVYFACLLAFMLQPKLMRRIPSSAPMLISILILMLVCIVQVSEPVKRILQFASFVDRKSSVSDRMLLWEQGVHAVMRNLKGCGFLNTFEDYIQSNMSGSHNFYIDVFLQTGIVGGTLFIALLFYCIRGVNQRRITMPIFSAVFSFAVMCNFEPYFSSITFAGIFMLFAVSLALNDKLPRASHVQNR